MAQPTDDELFGPGTTIAGGVLTVPLSGLTGDGLDSTTPLSVFAAIVSRANAWLLANTDLAVRATATKSSSAPVTRNGVSRTSHDFRFTFYDDYETPTFDPDRIGS